MSDVAIFDCMMHGLQDVHVGLISAGTAATRHTYLRKGMGIRRVVSSSVSATVIHTVSMPPLLMKLRLHICLYLIVFISSVLVYMSSDIVSF